MNLFDKFTSALPLAEFLARYGTDADRAKATSRNVIVERRPAKAGRMAGFPNAVTDLRGIVFDGLHGFGPIWPARRCNGLHGTASYGAPEFSGRRLNSSLFRPDKSLRYFGPTKFLLISSLVLSVAS